MKAYIKWQVLFTIILVFSGAGCSDFLDENAVSNQTADNYYNTAVGFEDLTRSIYPLLRDIYQQRDLVMHGTDIFAASGSWDAADQNGSPLDVYANGFGSTIAQLQDLWDVLYLEINRANTVISRAEFVEGIDASLKAQRVGEAKFIRGLMLFYAVQQWGDIPMPLEETTSASKEVIRVPSAEVYSQIIADLTEAESVLPQQSATDWGRVTKGAAQFVLARVYLTRGWNFGGSLGGGNADFGMALANADKVIAAYPLADNYSDLFPQRSENPLLETNNPGSQNAKNAEIVFAVQYSEDVLTSEGDPAAPNPQIGNDLHSIFGNGPDDTPGSPAGRTGEYNRFLGKVHVTPSMYRLYDPNIDSRYDHNFVETIYALRDAPGFVPVAGQTIDITAGDVTMEFRPWDNPVTSLEERGLDVGGTQPFAVVNTDEFGRIDQSTYHGNDRAMMMWKFWEPNIEYGDALGTFDFAMFRSAEAYLIAAEAILKGASGGSLGSADDYYNAVVDRALGSNAGDDPMQAASPADVSSLDAVSYRASSTNLTIDMILDERARELMGEYVRWYDLKRTEKLVERAKLHNPWTAAGSLSDMHYLRPIPLGELDLASNDLAQNPGY
ncbi:MAG: hypothetical protein ACJA01_004017 [Saprospiraceae bacterium]|jgi:hypothetical protein